jgi:hypothetical protein
MTQPLIGLTPEQIDEQNARSEQLLATQARANDKDARFGELGTLKRPDGDISTEVSITVTDPRINGGAPTNIPTLVHGQKNVDAILANKPISGEQQEIAIRRAAERAAAGAQLPSYPTIPAAVTAAQQRTADKGAGVPLSQQQQQPPAALLPGGFPGGAPVAAVAPAVEAPRALATVPQGPGIANSQAGNGIDPGILHALGTPGGAAGTTRQAGLSAADKAVDVARGGMLGIEQEHAQTQIESAQALAKAQADESEQGALDMRLATSKYSEAQQEQAKKREQLFAEAKETHGKIQNQLSELEAKGVDPNHYWSSQSTPAKILAAISIGLGAFASHPLGPRGHETTNTALGIINSAIGQDIDAQKINLQRGIELAKMKGAFAEGNFDHQQALLKAEQDSIQTAYSVAINDVNKRASMFHDNAEIQQKKDALVAGLTQSMDARTGQAIEQRYGLLKNAERPVTVGGTGDKLRQEILALASDKVKRAQEKGVALPITQAFREAYEEKTGQPGSREGYATAQPFPQKGEGAGQMSPRLRKSVAELDAAEKGIQELDALLNKGTGFSKSDRDRAAQQAEELKNLGVAVPEGSLDFTTNTTARRAGLAQALLGVRARKQALLTRGAGSVEGAGADAAEEPEKD